METVSIWKRVGGWLRRSQTSTSGTEVMHLDAEGMLVTPPDENEDENSNAALVSRTPKKEQPLAVMQEGFNRLVGVMESINESVVEQRRHSANIAESLVQVRDLIQVLPASSESQQQALGEMTEELKNQTLHSRQLVEIVKNLPELNQEQAERLGEIAAKLEASVETEARLSESFRQFDTSVQGMLNHSQAQATSLANIGQMLEKNEQRLQELVQKQQRRFTWLLLTVLAVIFLALAAVIYLFKPGT
ncbi:MAG: hypothetical protein JW860_08030 [Sedimentisphaerales bacterium]|nr:hypothetical protein [Sedimentisphaerales bacterium]